MHIYPYIDILGLFPFVRIYNVSFHSSVWYCSHGWFHGKYYFRFHMTQLRLKHFKSRWLLRVLHFCNYTDDNITL